MEKRMKKETLTRMETLRATPKVTAMPILHAAEPQS
jgi:hypothetical protein